MDIVTHVKTCLNTWSKGGEDECRKILSTPHTRVFDPECADVLITAYQTMLHASLHSWLGVSGTPFDIGNITAFVQGVLQSLPSTSSASSERSTNMSLFGELLVDLIWVIDGELDEVISDAKSALADNTLKDREVNAKERVESIKKTAEGDKGRLAVFLKSLLNANIVVPPTCRERLEVPLLASAGLIPDEVLFGRKEVRMRTALFYKQNKFNLLREQSEGYTKLTTDLVGSLGPSHSPQTARPVESITALNARAAAAWEKVVALIGYFDLDANRVLDIILDIFSVNITTHWQFFLALLSYSQWSGESDFLKYQESPENTPLDQNVDQYRGKSLDEILEIAESSAKGYTTMRKSESIGKPKVLAQVLGFKFAYYLSSETSEHCPRGLYLMAALLIREGFISLEDLYPHLGPSDEDMSKVYQKYLNDVQARVSASANNLLTMAAPLESNSIPSSSVPSKPKPALTETKPVETKEPAVQKAMIASALLSVGCIQPALALMSKFPWLVDVHHELADLLLHILKASISPLFESLYHKEKVVGCLQPRARYVSAGVLTTPVRKPQLTLCFPPPPSTHTHDFVFFFPRWSDWIPICKSLGDIVDVIEPIMRFVRIYISRDPMFVAKLLRLGKLQLLQSIESCSGVKAAAEMPPILEPEDEIQEFWLRIARRYLLPTLSMMSGNALFLVEIWQVLKLYDVSLRWGLYEEWRNVTYKSHPELNAQRIVIEREAKGILRRLSIKSESLSGTVAKMVHTNPIIFFTIALNQVQSYSNLSDVVLSSLKYCTIMGLDILVFLLLEALASPHKERVKEDGTNISDWLQNLASFTGDFFNRNSAINHATVLQYIVHQLLQGQTSDIIVLEKLIEKVSGVETLPGGVKDSQIAIMAGGPVLRTEYFSSRIRKEDNKDKQLENSIRKTPRLGKNLIETGLTFPILVQVAQQRQACVYNAKDPHLKSISSLFDTTHLVLFQYLEFLTSPDGIPLDEYRKSIPSLAELCNTYGISQPIAMQIIRPLLNDAVLKHAKQWKKQKEERAKAAEKRLKAALAAKRDPNSVLAIDSPNQADVPSDQNGTTSPDKMDVDTASARPQDKQNGNMEVETPQPSPWIEELSSLFDMCRAIAPGNVNDVVGPAFYLTFWQLSSYDLYYPKNIYIEVDKNLISEYDDLNVQLRQADRSPDKKQRALVTILRQKRDRLVGVINEFRKEKPAQEEVYQFTTEVDGRLEREKNHWFPHIGKGSAALIQSLIEHCFQPRCLLSPMDAVFCAQFIKTLHERGTPGFHTLMCYDKLLGDHVKVVIFSCSENEARNFGRFLKMILSDLHAWHKDQKVFEASNHRKVGTEQILLPGLQVHWSKDGPSSPDDLLKWADLKSFLRKCHRKLGQSFTDCLKAGDFMHVYNALLVLKEIIEVFPLASVNDVVGSKVDLEVQKLVETEERGDVKALARAYAASLKKREKLWAMPKSSQPVKPPGPKASPSLPNPAPIPDRPREQAVVTPPSGPRAITAAAPVVQKLPDQVTPPDRPASAARLAIESIPRPEVVKRNRDSKPPEAPAANIMKESRSNHMQVDSTPPQNQNNPQAVIVEDRQRTEPASAVPQHPPLRPAVRAGHPVNDLRKEVLQGMNNPPRPATPQSSSQMPQNGTRDLPQSPRGREREPGSPSMAPPVAPSQTLVAQELRSSRRGDRSMRTDLSPRRSSSPASRPGTRNASSDSRASGESKKEKARHDRGLEPEAEDSKRAVNVEAPSRAERGSGAHRDSLQTRSERAGRDRIPGSSTRDTDRERDRDSDRDRGRDREKDRDRERDRDREKRSRGERESHRERDRDRDRSDRDHERRRRDEKERDRKSSASTKEQEGVNEHGLPSRPDTSRHRTEEAHGGKRKRGADDEPERSNKSRHREGKHRKTSEKESSREQRRKDRDADNEPSTKLSTNERLPESQRLNDSKLTPLKVNTSLPPTGPRDRNLGQSPGPSSTRDRERERERDNDRDRSGRDRNERNGRGSDRQERLERESWPERDRNERGGGDRAREWKMNPAASNAAAASPSASGSLRDRIGDLGNTAGRNPADGASSRDEQNERLKRSLSDRDRDVAHEPPTDTSGTTQSKGTQKRPRIINRTRYDNGPGRIAQGALNGLSR